MRAPLRRRAACQWSRAVVCVACPGVEGLLCAPLSSERPPLPLRGTDGRRCQPRASGFGGSRPAPCGLLGSARRRVPGAETGFPGTRRTLLLREALPAVRGAGGGTSAPGRREGRDFRPRAPRRHRGATLRPARPGEAEEAGWRRRRRRGARPGRTGPGSPPRAAPRAAA